MKKLPIGIQTFSDIVENNYLYVDKTAYMYDLISTGKYYFISRPRRFGKSLLVSTLEAIFSGQKNLFQGLAIASLPYDWQVYPVIEISFSDIACATPQELTESIKQSLVQIAFTYHVTLPENLLPSQMLQKLVIALSQQSRVVLLVDEYDYPILQHLHSTEIADQMREILKNFYVAIKGLDRYLRFVLLTGVSKFAHTSIFSGLNNIQDISLHHRYNALCGYTQAEISAYFNQHLALVSNRLDCSTEELFATIKTWYNGYKFTEDENAIKVHNPYSILLFLDNQKFSNYWFKTGTPTFLINMLKNKQYPLEDFENIQASESELDRFEIDNIQLKSLLFQTGYLTIDHYLPESQNYVLTFPNQETAVSLCQIVFASMTTVSESFLNTLAMQLRKIFYHNNLNALNETLTQLYAIIPYSIQVRDEKYYQTIFYVALKIVGAHILVEQPTAIGRLDAIVETDSKVFIIEFKINGTAQEAVQQIRAKKYYEPYLLSDKNIVLIGISFDMVSKNISEVICENYV